MVKKEKMNFAAMLFSTGTDSLKGIRSVAGLILEIYTSSQEKRSFFALHIYICVCVCVCVYI